MVLTEILVQQILEWLPYIGIATIPGIVNIIVALKEFDKKCRFLPFFKPHKSLGFWVWAFIQFLFPSFLFWLVATLSNKPNINLELIFKALSLGIGFVAVLNASTEIGSWAVKIKPIYDFFIEIPYQLIAAQENSRTAEFWTKLELEINQNYIDTIQGLNYLEQYFINDLSLNQLKKEDYQKKIEQFRNKAIKEKPVKDIIILIKNVRRKDLYATLKKFNFSDTFIDEIFYFSKK